LGGEIKIEVIIGEIRSASQTVTKASFGGGGVYRMGG